MTGPTSQSLEEVRVLLLRYLEGDLPQEEARKVSELLRTSEEARRELDGLRRIMDTLNTDKTLFCPDPSEIAEFIASGRDPNGKIARHLKECPSCQEEAHSFKSFQPAATIPPEIWSRVSRKLAERSPIAAKTTPEERSSGFIAWLSQLFRAPVFAIGSAAAVAVLLVVFLYPRHPAGPMLMLSSTSWEQDLTVKIPALPRDRERVAFLILLKDFKTPLSQERIDSLYDALKPDEQVQKLYNLIAPAEIKKALAGTAPDASHEDYLTALQTDLKVQRVLFITLTSEKGQITIRCESAGGTTKVEPVETVATEHTLSSKLRDAAYRALGVKTSRTG